jgi:putative inorganic carbon (HCO3(-)) transporter
MSSDRIFSTLFYPNTLAGVLLLLLPASLATIGLQRERLTAGARALLAGLLGLGALGCLYWSKSKGGWLLMLILGLVALLRMRFAQRTKTILVGAILVVGLAGFALRFAGYFQKGATSAVARGDYWRAAAQTALANPVFGTGPGTFAIPYKQIKKPESEMTRMVHNDYLQQASDSGLVGGAAYLVFIAGTLWAGWRKLAPRDNWLMFSVWLGLLGWSLQSLMEFGLYIPAVAWPAFTLMGWLLAAGNEFDKKPVNP